MERNGEWTETRLEEWSDTFFFHFSYVGSAFLCSLIHTFLHLLIVDINCRTSLRRPGKWKKARNTC